MTDAGPPRRGPSAALPVHSRLGRGLVATALGTGIAGLALGNPVFLVLAATVALLLHAARAGWPGHGTVSLQLSATRAPRGSTVEADIVATSAPGPAALWLHAALPGAFTLETGTNVTIAAPGGSARERFTVGLPKRGPFTVAGATLTAVHPHLLAPATEIARSDPVEIVVEPRVKPLRKAKQIRAQSRVRVGEDRAPRGPGGTDFREIREYERGDPLKAVNWKVTAKRSVGELELMVNQFEPEARKNVWFFLDLGARMEVGTSLHNALEDAIEATLALTHHFTSRGHRVGGTTYNAPPLVFYPDSGSRQHLTIARGLAHALPGATDEGLPTAVERVRGFLARERPVVFVVTRPELDPDGVVAGAKRIRSFASRTRPHPVFVVAPRPTPSSRAEAMGRALQALETRVRLGSSAGLRVLPLARGIESLDAALSKGVLLR